ncbi:hypothetical protein ID853_05725 [Xenorhabdus sp. Vera]|nr:hypothetical protein [Xenorhabdus sp. Vera]
MKNVLGFNADAAWGGVDGGVEIPMCKNNIRQGYSDGDLIDIPAGRSISVRVQMPEDSVWNVRQATQDSG